MTPFSSLCVQGFNPPNVGVVGPLHKGGNEEILTYDFVHRSHIDVFGYYYPRVFTDWWADNWMSQVRTEIRTRTMSSFSVSLALIFVIFCAIRSFPEALNCGNSFKVTSQCSVLLCVSFIEDVGGGVVQSAVLLFYSFLNYTAS